MIEWRWFGFARYHRLPSVQCDGCDFARRVGGAGEICAMHEWLYTLAHNLAVGAALYAAFSLGRDWQRSYDCGPGHRNARIMFADKHCWRPGCGRAVP